MTLAGFAADADGDPLAVAEQSLRRMRLQSPDDRARSRGQIIELCMPWARREAARYRNRGEHLDDLTQVALVGLVLAVDRYDPGRGVPFRHFALPTVTGEIKKYFRDRGWSMRVSREIQERYQEVRRVEPILTQRLGRTPSDRELAEHLHLSHEDIRHARQGELAYRAKSLNRPTFDTGDPVELVDSLGGPDPAIDHVVDMDALRRAIPVLPARLRTVLSLRFLDDLTQCEIAEKMGVSQMHVSRLLARALGQLRRHMLAEAPARHAGPAGVRPSARRHSHTQSRQPTTG